MTELDEDTFDLDGWIDQVTRPRETVRLYQKGHLTQRLQEIEDQILLVRKTPPEDRGINDPTAESLNAEADEVAKELLESAIPVTVQALTNVELQAAKAAAQKAKAKENEEYFWILSAATVKPKISPEQMLRIRDNGGEGQLGEMIQVVLRLSNEAPRPTVPSSPGASRGIRA